MIYAGVGTSLVNDSIPRLSIGLPVYNGEPYLRFAIESLLHQTYRDFELIISDNASTDHTMHICLEYAARDPRIQYHRNPENIGAADNFNRVFELSKGEFFKWAAADDVVESTYCEKCIDFLDNHPSYTLCHSKVNRINPDGRVDGVYDFPMRLNAMEPSIRFSESILIPHYCITVFGVMRREIFGHTALIGKYEGSDRVLIAELCLKGQINEIPEYLFYRRNHPESLISKYAKRYRLEWYDPAKRNHLNLVYFHIVYEYIRLVMRTRLPWKERVGCNKAIVYWLILNRRSLIEDIRVIIVRFFPFSDVIIKKMLKFVRGPKNA